MITAYIALGSNLGDRRQHLDRALDDLRRQPGVQVTNVSTYHETDPVGGPPGQGRYLNAAAELQTDLPPRELMQLLLDIEQRHGRVRGVKDAPRTIDLDLILYGDQTIDEPDLVVPHPRMDERLFVLEPLAELAPELIHPLHQTSVKHLAGHLRVDHDLRLYKQEAEDVRRRYHAAKEALERNPHPRKRRHLRQAMQAVLQRDRELEARYESIKAMHDELHRHGPCHHPTSETPS